MLPVPSVPTKREWKTIVNGTLNQSEAALWIHRLAIDSDFTFFRILHPSFTPSALYRVCNRSSYRYIMLIVARLWTRPVVLENRLCDNCKLVYQEELALSECSVTSTIRTHFLEQLTDILLPDEKHSVLALDSVAFSLKLLGAPVEPIFDASTDHMFLRIAFLVIVNCVKVFVG